MLSLMMRVESGWLECLREDVDVLLMERSRDGRFINIR